MLEGAGKIWERWCWKVLPRCGMCYVYYTIGFLVGVEKNWQEFYHSNTTFGCKSEKGREKKKYIYIYIYIFLLMCLDIEKKENKKM